ncbi:hypothetical protein C8R44DRAFT_652605 [Mycena epipterygia]|nr:hypothetical protein C8R44DRAFT_652605 [Mycena epipterygia]
MREPSAAVCDDDTHKPSAAPPDNLPFPQGDHWTYPVGVNGPAEDHDDDWNKRAHLTACLLISVSPAVTQEFVKGYEEDNYFKSRYVEDTPNPNKLLTPSRFQKGRDGLLYFIDADFTTCLCVPRSKVPFIMK